MAAADQCELCQRELGDGEGRRTRVRRSERIARAALETPRHANLAYRSRSHAFYDEPALVCAACLEAMDEEADRRDAALRRATLTLGAAALGLMLLALGFAYFNPDAGPDLLGYVWRDPHARPRPDPRQPPPAYTPYRPPFGG